MVAMVGRPLGGCLVGGVGGGPFQTHPFHPHDHSSGNGSGSEPLVVVGVVEVAVGVASVGTVVPGGCLAPHNYCVLLLGPAPVPLGIPHPVSVPLVIPILMPHQCPRPPYCLLSVALSAALPGLTSVYPVMPIPILIPISVYPQQHPSVAVTTEHSLAP